jgi:hypothetical protein
MHKPSGRLGGESSMGREQEGQTLRRSWTRAEPRPTLAWLAMGVPEGGALMLLWGWSLMRAGRREIPEPRMGARLDARVHGRFPAFSLGIARDSASSGAVRPYVARGPGIPQLPMALPVPLHAHRYQLLPHVQVVARPILSGLHHEYRLEKAG